MFMEDNSNQSSELKQVEQLMQKPAGFKNKNISGSTMVKALALSLFWSPVFSYNLLGFICSRPGAARCDEGALGVLIILCFVSFIIFWLIFTFIFTLLKGKVSMIIFSLFLLIPFITIGIGMYVAHLRVQNTEKTFPSKLQVDYSLTPENAQHRGYKLIYSNLKENVMSDSNTIYLLKWYNYKLGGSENSTIPDVIGVYAPIN